MRLACSSNRVGGGGSGGHEPADSFRTGEVESVGTLELVCVGEPLRMGCDLFPMSACGIVGGEERLW